MFSTVLLAICIFWHMDLMDMPFMKVFDTTYPLNGVFWICTALITIIVIGLNTDDED